MILVELPKNQIQPFDRHSGELLKNGVNDVKAIDTCVEVERLDVLQTFDLIREGVGHCVVEPVLGVL